MWQQFGNNNFLIFNIVEYVEVVERNVGWKFLGKTTKYRHRLSQASAYVQFETLFTLRKNLMYN